MNTSLTPLTSITACCLTHPCLSACRLFIHGVPVGIQSLCSERWRAVEGLSPHRAALWGFSVGWKDHGFLVRTQPTIRASPPCILDWHSAHRFGASADDWTHWKEALRDWGESSDYRPCRKSPHQISNKNSSGFVVECLKYKVIIPLVCLLFTVFLSYRSLLDGFNYWIMWNIRFWLWLTCRWCRCSPL